MVKGRIHIGTSGWSYKHWKGDLYDAKLKPTEYLSFYSSLFGTTEINTSFYHLPKIETVQGWVNNVPNDFKFCPKMSRYITHMKKLHNAAEPLDRMMDVFKPMRKKLGPILIQLPPFLKYRAEVTEEFFEVLKAYKQSFVLEVRHESWLCDEVLDQLKRYKVGFVVSQSNGKFPYAEDITAEHIYYRFHGPDTLYSSTYNDDALAEYAKRFIEYINKGHTVWAYFNNDINGYAFRNAIRLKELIDEYS